jgi:uncharacterized protein YdhG (YjbR/CyaY superfamily)
MADTKTTPKRASGRGSSNVWSDEERAAMQESARERKASSKRSPEEEREAGEREVQDKIAEMPGPDRDLAERIHALVAATAPAFVPRTYYGMPAYSLDGKVICFFQPKSKFKVRYATLGFQPDARLDDGEMWPVAFAIDRWTPDVEARVTDLLRQVSR